MQAIYGWAALQFQAWARGSLFVYGDVPQTVLLYTEYILEFYVDGVHHFGGDYYGFKRVPIVLQLEPGLHVLDVRLVRDVRAMGGVGFPTISVSLTAELVSSHVLSLASDTALLPEMVNGRLAGALGSITVRNDGVRDLEVTGVSVNDTSYFVWLAKPWNIRVVAGQTRPISFVISCQTGCSPDVRFDIEYADPSSHGDDTSVLSIHQTIVQRRIDEPHKRTFLHPGGMVSYSILRPPNPNASCPTGAETKLPVLLALHGAGLEAGSELVKHALDPLPDLCAWVLFPTGSTPWSGDDWHTWGFADVEAAVESLPLWLDLVDWQGPGVDVDSWLVSGHSNGGQGTWYTLTHRPDKVIAAAPVSGYSSIQNYVPYDLWQPLDPTVRAILEAAIGGYKHERLLSNAAHIPIQQQHGEVDDNVPAFHSRLMNSRLRQAGIDAHYLELPDKNHWFSGVMTTKALSDFYRDSLSSARSSFKPPSGFTIAVANPADTGSKHGITVLYLDVPGQIGKVQVSFSSDNSLCHITTSNILSLRLSGLYPQTHDIVIDGQQLDLYTTRWDVDLWRASDEIWKPIAAHSPALRKTRQLGSMDAVLRTTGTLQIMRHSAGTYRHALQISRNMCQYFAADTNIIDSSLVLDYGNVVRVAMGRDLLSSDEDTIDFPLAINSNGTISVRLPTGQHKLYSVPGGPGDAGLAAIFVRPARDDGLELVVWGSNNEGLEIAARLVPMLTGVGQPDFVIATRRMLQEGAGGVLAMGFFDHMWNVTANSFFT